MMFDLIVFFTVIPITGLLIYRLISPAIGNEEIRVDQDGNQYIKN